MPDNIQSEWVKLVKDLNSILDYNIPRYIEGATLVPSSLHFFSDSSSIVYGCCAYIANEFGAKLLTAKAYVAPIK